MSCQADHRVAPCLVFPVDLFNEVYTSSITTHAETALSLARLRIRGGEKTTTTFFGGSYANLYFFTHMKAGVSFFLICHIGVRWLRAVLGGGWGGHVDAGQGSMRPGPALYAAEPGGGK